MSSARRVVFVGAYGIQNAGDDAPLLALTEGLRRRFPAVEFDFTVIARRADPPLEAASGARFLPNLEHESREAARGRSFRGFNPGDDRADLERIEAAIREADLLVAGAGNVLIDLTIDWMRGPIPLLALHAFLADLHRTPVLLYGIAAGPLRTQRGRDLSAWIARRAAAVTVRDPSSARLLAELAPEVETEVLPDPVLGLRPASDGDFERALELEGIPLRAGRPRLALALRELDSLGLAGADAGRTGATRGARALVVETLQRLARRWELLFVPQCTDRDCDDRGEAAAVLRALGAVPAYAVRARHAPGVLMRFYETADATLAIRLHGAVFSALRGAPAVGLAYLPKVRSFFDQVGLDDSCFDLDAATPERLAAAIERSLEVDRADLRRRCEALASGVSLYVERAGQLLELIPAGEGEAPELLESGRRSPACAAPF